VHSSFRAELNAERRRREQAEALSGPDEPYRVAGHGIDTVSFAWRDFDARRALRRVSVPAPDPDTGEMLNPKRKGGASWLTDPLSGARVGVTRSPTGALLLWCEARLAALCAGDANNHSLARPSQLPVGAATAEALASRLGFGTVTGGTLVRRLDLATDLAFARAVDGSAFLRAVSFLDCPGYKRVPTHAKGSSEVEGVEWRTPSSYRIVQRCYDKGRESGTAHPGRLLRLERQWWVPSRERADVASLTSAENLRRLFAGPLRAWVESAAEVVAVGPYDACTLLRERVGKPLGKNRDGRLLTLRVAERLAGTIGVLSVSGDAWYDNRRTAQRRRAELRGVGVEFVSELPAGRRVHVGSVLAAACDVWHAPPQVAMRTSHPGRLRQ